MNISVINRNIKPILAILFIALISITWFDGNNLFSGTDSYFPLQRASSTLNHLYTWDSESFGAPSASVAVLFPYGAWLLLTEYFNIEIASTQHIWFYYIFASSGISMYVLTKVFLTSNLNTKHENLNLLAFMSSLLYMFNTYVSFMATSYTYIWLTYAFIPLKLAMYIYGLKKEKGILYIFFTILIWTITSNNQYTNPKYLVLDLLPVILYFAYSLIHDFKNKIKLKKIISYSVTFTTILILLNAYWLIPNIEALKYSVTNVNSAYETIGLTRLTGYGLNSSSGISNIFKLNGFWATNGQHQGIKYFDFSTALNGKLFSIIGYATTIILLIFLRIYLKRKYYDDYIFFIIFLTLAIFGSSGSSTKFESINLYLADKIPFFVDLFSYPFQIFGLYIWLCYSILLPISLFKIIDSFKKTKINIISGNHWNKLAISILLLIIVTLGKPVISGELMSPRKANTEKVLPSYLYSIPSYYFDLKTLVDNNNKDDNPKRVLSIPYSKIGGATYLWNKGYAGTNILSVIGIDNISGENPLSIAIEKSLSSHDTNTKEIQSLLSYGQLEYVVINKDSHPNLSKIDELYNPNLIEKLNKLSSTNSALNLDDKLVVFKMKKDEIPNDIYISKSQVFTNNESNNFFAINKFTSEYSASQNKPDILVLNKNENFEQYKNNKLILSDLNPNVPSLNNFNKESWEAGWSLPNTRISPTSSLYKIALIKESLELLLNKKNSIEKIDHLIWLSAKRIAEIDRYDLNDSQIKNLLERHESIQLEIEENIKNINEIEKSELEQIERKRYLYTKMSETYLKDKFKTENSLTLQYQKSFAEIYRAYIKKYGSISCQYVCYQMIVPLTGKYDVLLETSKLKSLGEGFRIEIIQNDEETLYGSNQIDINNESDYTKLTNLDLNSDDIYSLNIIRDNTESEAFRKSSNSNLNEDILYDNQTLAYFLDNLDQNSEYQISFDFSGLENSILIVYSREKVLDYLSGKIKKDKNLFDRIINEQPQKCETTIKCDTIFTQNIKTSNGHISADIVIQLKANTLSPNTRRLTIKNLKVLKIVKPEILFVYNQNDKVENNSIQVQYEKINPTKYKVFIKDINLNEPFTIILNEKFHKNWQINKETQVKNGNTISMFISSFTQTGIESSTHREANGYANAWTINPKNLDIGNTTEVELEIEFSAQRYLELGIMISVISFSVLIISILVLKSFSYLKRSKGKMQNEL